MKNQLPIQQDFNAHLWGNLTQIGNDTDNSVVSFVCHERKYPETWDAERALQRLQLISNLHSLD